MNLIIETRIEKDFEIVKRNFNLDLFDALRPPFPLVKILQYQGNLPGNLVEVELNFILFKWIWLSEITAFEENNTLFRFTDLGRKLPPFLSEWKHTHALEKIGSETKIIDDITFQAGKFWPDALVKLLIWFQFSQRPGLYKAYFSKKT